MFNKAKNYFKNNVECIAMGLAAVYGTDFLPFID